MTQPSALKWPADEIEARAAPDRCAGVRLLPLLQASQHQGRRHAGGVSCRADDELTPPARLAAAGKRLDTMLQAVKQVRAALDRFYTTLNDEQKAQFEAIGPRRTSLADRADIMQRRGRR